MVSKIWRKLLKLELAVEDELIALSMKFRSGVAQKVFNLPDLESRGKKLVVLAHYSDCGTVHPYVDHFILAMKSAGCDVMLVSSAGSLENESINRLSKLVIALVVRENIGYDFGSWKAAVELYPEMRNDYSTIIFANDSVYGPVLDVSAALEKADSRGLELWGLTSSRERLYHVQSYFWGVSGGALKGGFFDYFWNQYYRYYSRRQKVIDRYELSLARLAQGRFALKVGACYEIDSVLRSARLSSNAWQARSAEACETKLNPMHHLWQELLVNQKFPFVKRELLKKDPFKLDCFDDIAKEMKRLKPEFWDVVESHLSEENK